MILNFEIATVPKKTDGYHVPSYVEGLLQVVIGQEAWMNLEGVLLVELAIVLKRWISRLEAAPGAGMFYSSMDFEEEPVLSFTPEESVYVVSSAFSAGDKRVPRTEVTDSVEVFLDALDKSLRDRINVRLRDILKANL